MTRPLDLVEMRARYADTAGGSEVVSLIDEVERLRAENANLDESLRLEIKESVEYQARVAPVVEAAEALHNIATDRDWENTVWVAHMDYWEPAERDALEALGHAVAAYEQAQRSQHEPGCPLSMPLHFGSCGCGRGAQEKP